jgi:hypothetical protein
MLQPDFGVGVPAGFVSSILGMICLDVMLASSHHCGDFSAIPKIYMCSFALSFPMLPNCLVVVCSVIEWRLDGAKQVLLLQEVGC